MTQYRGSLGGAPQQVWGREQVRIKGIFESEILVASVFMVHDLRVLPGNWLVDFGYIFGS